MARSAISPAVTAPTVGRAHQVDLTALDGDQVASQRARIDDGYGQPGGVDERGDDERGLGGPSTVDGGPADARGDGDALDREADVSLFLQDLERRGEDRLVTSGVAGSTRTPASPGVILGLLS